MAFDFSFYTVMAHVNLEKEEKKYWYYRIVKTEKEISRLSIYISESKPIKY